MPLGGAQCPSRIQNKTPNHQDWVKTFFLHMLFILKSAWTSCTTFRGHVRPFVRPQEFFLFLLLPLHPSHPRHYRHHGHTLYTLLYLRYTLLHTRYTLLHPRYTLLHPNHMPSIPSHILYHPFTLTVIPCKSRPGCRIHIFVSLFLSVLLLHKTMD